MKKSLLQSITWITLVALTATTLYAQTTTGNSVISKMKAAVSAFTLAGDLNPGQTGLQSAPVSGKKTGDILTAGEWNRVLELLSEWGTVAGWSLQISFKKDYSKDGNSSVPTTENIGSHDFCALTRYGEGALSDSTAGYCKVEKETSGLWTVSIQALNNNINCQVTCFKSGNNGSSNSGWTSTCPTGMSLVGTAGTRNAFCIETNLRTGTIYHNAAENCRTAGRSLCTYEQWTTACLDQASTNRKPIPALVWVHSSREWILWAQTWSGGTYQGGMVIGHLTNSGSPSCLNSSALDDDVEAVAATVKYRCCSY